MKHIVRGLLASVMVLSGTGCLKNDGERVKSASWENSKAPSDGKPISTAPSPRIAPATHLASGRMLEQQNDLAGAIRQYEKALAASPDLIEAHNRMGISFQKLERYMDAEEAFKRGIRIAPDSAMLHNNLGYCLLVQNKYQPAEREFRDALVISPTFERARMNLGIVLAKTDRIKESVEAFNLVVPAEVSYYNVAVLCVEQQKYQAAADALNRCLKINPDYLPARKELNAILALADEARGPDRIHVRMAGDPDAESIDVEP